MNRKNRAIVLDELLVRSMMNDLEMNQPTLSKIAEDCLKDSISRTQGSIAEIQERLMIIWNDMTNSKNGEEEGSEEAGKEIHMGFNVSCGEQAKVALYFSIWVSNHGSDREKWARRKGLQLYKPMARSVLNSPLTIMRKQVGNFAAGRLTYFLSFWTRDWGSKGLIQRDKFSSLGWHTQYNCFLYEHPRVEASFGRDVQSSMAITILFAKLGSSN